jgi:ATP-binding cassette subfamily F protein 3
LENAIELAKTYYKKPDLILSLPTTWISKYSMVRGFLINSAKAVVVISHDRAFVDNIITNLLK